MKHGITGLDHVIVGVRDLEDARERWARLGFAVTPRGRHKGWGTANYCIMFESDYVELLGIVDPAQFTNNLDRFLDKREGLMSVCFASANSDATKGSLAAAGFDAEGPKDLARFLELPEGDVEPSFKLVFPAEAATPGLPSFICQHLTPDLIRQPDWLRHPNGAKGIRTIGIVVDRPLEIEDAYVRLFGPGAVIETDNAIAVRLGQTSLLFASPDDFDLFSPEMDPDFPYDPPQIMSLSIVTSDREAAAAALEEGGVPFRRMNDGTIAVQPEDANGVLVEFVSD